MENITNLEFYAEGRKIPNAQVIYYAYPFNSGGVSLEERLGDGSCDECGNKSWVFLPRKILELNDMKPYITCRMCGAGTHL